MKEMDLDKTGSTQPEESEKPNIPLYSGSTDYRDTITKTLFGTLEVEGDGIYYAFLTQARTKKTWILTDQEVFNATAKSSDHVVAMLRSFSTGRLEGYGKTFLLTRLMSNISTMTYQCVNSGNVSSGFFMTAEYSQPSTGNFISFTTTAGGQTYDKLELVYEGFKLSLSPFRNKLPFALPKLSPVQDSKSKAAVVANLGIKTAASLFRQMGERLDWFKKKKYTLIDTKEKFEEMMVNFMNSVQTAHDNSLSVLVGLDTETTGLNMYDLQPDNPYRDSIVCIPFAWEDNKAYVICTDMYYFSNVSDEMVYPLFQKLFSRNPDFTFQDIEMDYCGNHYSFNRQNMTVAGWNVMFDEMAFFTHDCDIFFDEDGRQLFFNLNTDLVQGKFGQQDGSSYRISNSLKMQTRRMIGDETLELDELFGKGHEDKFRYLQDALLALVYGGADADYTRLVVKIGRLMTEKNLYQQYRKYDMTIAYMLARASWRGMPIDTSGVREQGELVYKDLERLKDFIYHYAWLANRETLNDKSDKLQELLGLESAVEVEEVMEKDKMFRYPFTPANHKKLLFGMLGYPVVKRAEKSGEPALDKFVLKKLMSPKRENPAEILLEDLESLSDPSTPLVSKADFNNDAYPLARVFSTYSKLNKEYTSYYRPIMDNDMEGRMFYGFTMARAATRRILSPGQTMKGSLKGLVIAPPGKIFMSFDASQIEYRHMASLAYIRAKKLLQMQYPDDWERRLNETSISRIHAMMQREEADYHIETAASMTGVRQHEVTSKVRKQYKSIGFGIPYGLGEKAMCESIHGGVVNDQTMKETRELLASYKLKQKEIIDLLEGTRDSAFLPANISEEHRKYLGVGDSHVGLVRNFVGFYRVFILEDLTRAHTGRIRRQAGNCIIQGGAAELFRRMLYNFHIGCCKYGIQDKIQWLMTVHDELDAVIDADIDIVLLIKVLYENCTLRYTDHIPYYIGINFGANWLDAKADANELPVIMVQRMIEAYDAGKFKIPSDGNQANNLLVLKRHYMCDRIEEELKQIFPSLVPGHVWTDEEVAIVDDKFENYVVRAYLDVFTSKGSSLKKSLEDWQKSREEYGFGVSFLTTKFKAVSEEFDINDIDFDTTGDLGIDIFDDSSEEDAILEREGGGWFDERSMFDQNAAPEDIVVDSESSEYFINSLNDKEDTLVLNQNPTNAFDVFVSTKYTRTKVLKVKDDVYSVMLNNTLFNGKEAELKRQIRSHFTAGSSTIVLIGATVLKLPNMNCTEEDLNWLDQLLCKQ